MILCLQKCTEYYCIAIQVNQDDCIHSVYSTHSVFINYK